MGVDFCKTMLGGCNDERENTLNQLLVEMDGLPLSLSVSLTHTHSRSLSLTHTHTHTHARAHWTTTSARTPSTSSSSRCTVCRTAHRLFVSLNYRRATNKEQNIVVLAGTKRADISGPPYTHFEFSVTSSHVPEHMCSNLVQAGSSRVIKLDAWRVNKLNNPG